MKEPDVEGEHGGGIEGEEEFVVLVRQLDELSKGVRSAFGGYSPLILSL